MCERPLVSAARWTLLRRPSWKMQVDFSYLDRSRKAAGQKVDVNVHLFKVKKCVYKNK
jgi:hypothetical protein